MIKGLVGDEYITVAGGNTSVPYINQNVVNPMQGMIRVWGSDIQVFDGSNWMTMNTSYASVSLGDAWQSALAWAMNKMIEEQKMLEITNKHPAVKIAMDNLNKAKQQLDATIILSKEYDKSTS
jgi:hypothetical protein